MTTFLVAVTCFMASRILLLLLYRVCVENVKCLFSQHRYRESYAMLLCSAAYRACVDVQCLVLGQRIEGLRDVGAS